MKIKNVPANCFIASSQTNEKTGFQSLIKTLLRETKFFFTIFVSLYKKVKNEAIQI
jgi:hypothetical protein